ncbi:MAG: hypothetical protein PHW73_00640 [Atribacterota bacterium]|nr:hypothetical protein [Atribacterota bacterium]
MKNIKVFIFLPFRQNIHLRPKWYEYYPLAAGIYFIFDKYNFRYPDTGEGAYYPKGDKEGSHLFTLGIRILYWSVSIIVYRPGKI